MSTRNWTTPCCHAQCLSTPTVGETGLCPDHTPCECEKAGATAEDLQEMGHHDSCPRWRPVTYVGDDD